jgi:hypothetical protein
MMRRAADTAEAAWSVVALVGIPAITCFGFVELIQAATVFLGLL